MREILFRAKRIDNGEWIEGDLVHSVYKINDVCVGKYGSEIGMHQIDPETICQYSGLTDKNGNMIWENDIIKFIWDGKENVDVVKYNAPIFTPSKSFRWSLYKDEVIGNIFDNRDLLKGE